MDFASGVSLKNEYIMIHHMSSKTEPICNLRGLWATTVCMRVNKFFSGIQKPVFPPLPHVCLVKNHIPEWLPCWKNTISNQIPCAEGWARWASARHTNNSFAPRAQQGPACLWNLQLFKVKMQDELNKKVKQVCNRVTKFKRY